MKKRVPISELRIGYSLEADIQGNNGQTLIAKGVVLNQNHLDRLRRWFAKSDYMFVIDDGEEEIVKAPKTKQQQVEDLQTDTLKHLKDVYRAYGVDLDKALAALDPEIFHLCDDLKSVEDMPEDVIKIVYANKPGSHYFRLTRMAVAFASIYNKGKTADMQIPLKSICLASLLHDFGKRYKNDPKGLAELQFDSSSLLGTNISPSKIGSTYDSQLHSVYSYVALKGKVPEDVRKMILYCNYSDLKTQISVRPEVKAAGIISICDTYDSLLEHVIDNDLQCPFENVISYMNQLAHNGALDSGLYQTFLRHIPIYPRGTKILLSNGLHAVVLDKTEGYPTRPVVIAIEGTKTKLINLSEQNDVTIRRVISDEDNPQTKVEAIESSQTQSSTAEEKATGCVIDTDTTATLELQSESFDKPKTLNKKLKDFFYR